MNKQHVDRLLTFTGVAVVLFGLYVAASWHQYETDRDNHRASFITNDHVTNLHHELVKGE